jgi:hypothetical protein
MLVSTLNSQMNLVSENKNHFIQQLISGIVKYIT